MQQRRPRSRRRGWEVELILSNDSMMHGCLNLAGHFHDTGAGTATPRSYQYAWNDDIIVANQFAGILTDATEAIASGLNTETVGTPIVVFNPLNIAREDVVDSQRRISARNAKGRSCE